MIQNIMAKYIEHTGIFINELMQEYFKDKYDEEAVEEYIETYIDARYNNYGGNPKQRIFYRRIYSALLEKKTKLAKTANEEKKQDLQNMLEVFQYIFYIDFVRTIKIDLKEFVRQMYETRTIKFGFKRDGSFRDNVYKMIKKYRDEKEKYLDSFETEDFELATIKYPNLKDIYKVELKYNFKMPYIFSKEVITEVYNENIINEDKLMIQYVLLTVFNVRMILQGKFNIQYLVDLPAAMLSKKKKLQNILNIISHQSIQDKIKIKLKYRDFLLNKDLIYDLMQDGYKFAIIIDDAFIINSENLKKLEMFDYIIINDKSEQYEQLLQELEQLKNIIIDEG